MSELSVASKETCATMFLGSADFEHQFASSYFSSAGKKNKLEWSSPRGFSLLHDLDIRFVNIVALLPQNQQKTQQGMGTGCRTQGHIKNPIDKVFLYKTCITLSTMTKIDFDSQQLICYQPWLTFVKQRWHWEETKHATLQPKYGDFELTNPKPVSKAPARPPSLLVLLITLLVNHIIFSVAMGSA